MVDLQRLREVLRSIPKLNDTIVDIHYDETGKVVGFVCSEAFSQMADYQSQQLIWEAIHSNFGNDDIIGIDIIYHETPQERLLRLDECEANGNRGDIHNYWFHESPDMCKYWVFVDVGKFDDTYKSIFISFNAKDKFNRGTTFEYPGEVVEFMELHNDKEVYEELYSHVIQSAEAEVKAELARKYELETSKHLYGRDNIFSYVFKDFRLTAKAAREVIFDDVELQIIEPLLDSFEGFPIKPHLQKQVLASRSIKKDSIRFGL